MWHVYVAGILVAVFCAGMWAGFNWLTALEGEYECEVLEGYDPSGEAQDEAYPPDTFAGMCQRQKGGVLTFHAVILGIGLAVIALILAWVIWTYIVWGR